MQKNVLLTGATGAVGAALLPELLSLGFTVYCLVRPKDGQSPAARLAGISRDPHAIAIAGDVTRPLCGVDIAGLKIDKLVHAAADTSLVESQSSAVIGANRDGTLNAMALCRALGNCEFHYVGATCKTLPVELAGGAADAPAARFADAGLIVTLPARRSGRTSPVVRLQHARRADHAAVRLVVT